MAMLSCVKVAKFDFIITQYFNFQGVGSENYVLVDQLTCFLNQRSRNRFTSKLTLDAYVSFLLFTGNDETFMRYLCRIYCDPADLQSAPLLTNRSMSEQTNSP